MFFKKESFFLPAVQLNCKSTLFFLFVKKLFLRLFSRSGNRPEYEKTAKKIP